MHFTTLAAAGLMALTANAGTSSYAIQNRCDRSVWITRAYQNLTTGTNEWTGATEIASGKYFLALIEGEGNQAGITNAADDYWSATGAKLIFGTSTDNTTLYWDIGDQIDDPFKGQTINVTSFGAHHTKDVCGHASNYDSGVHGCADNHVGLTVNLCSQNA